MKKYFAYDFDNNVEFFDTEEEARKCAEGSLELAQEEATDTGWPESTTDICYGKLIGHVVETKRIDRPDDIDSETGEDGAGNSWQDEWKYMAWHELKEVR